MLGELNLLGLDIMVQLFIILPSKGEFAAEKSIEKHAKSPNISWRTWVFYFAHYFWSHVGWGAAEYFDFALMRNACWETKVYQFDSFIGLIEKYILKFDISVRDISLMAIVNWLYNLSP